MVFCFGFQMPEYKFTKILLQVLLVMKHKQNQMLQEKKSDILPWRDSSKAKENELMRELCILSSWRIKFSALFDELVRVYAWWMYEDERGKRINKSSAKGKLGDPGSFTTSVRQDTQYHTVLIIHTL